MSKIKTKKNQDKINEWTDAICCATANIKDLAAKIASGAVGIPSTEILCMIRHMTQYLDMIGDYEALIDEEEKKK